MTYLNGIQIGSYGSDSPDCHDPLFFRTYTIPDGLLDPHGRNVVAVRVHSAATDDSNPAGLFDSGAKDERVGPLDPGASIGEHSVGYAVFGEAWYRKEFELHVNSTRNVLIEFDGV